jgi:hypothetical protein
MMNTDKLWQDMKEDYLCRVEAALMMTDKAARQNILNDVDEHLDRRYAELTPERKNREQFEAIIIDMGPAQDYADLLLLKTESHGSRYVPSKGLVFLNRLTTGLYLLVLFGVVIMHVGMGTTIGPYRDSWVPPFVNDPNLVGTWISVDFVRSSEDFVPGQKCWKGGDLYLKRMVFLDGGTTVGPWRWAKGEIYHPVEKTHAKYQIRHIDGQSYLFFEWMSGDVTLLGRKPCYYILKKEVQ